MMHQNVTSIENYHFVIDFCGHHRLKTPYNHHTQRNLPWNVFIISIQATLFHCLCCNMHIDMNMTSLQDT